MGHQHSFDVLGCKHQFLDNRSQEVPPWNDWQVGGDCMWHFKDVVNICQAVVFVWCREKLWVEKLLNHWINMKQLSACFGSENLVDQKIGHLDGATRKVSWETWCSCHFTVIQSVTKYKLYHLWAFVLFFMKTVSFLSREYVRELKTLPWWIWQGANKKCFSCRRLALIWKCSKSGKQQVSTVCVSASQF